MQIKDGLVFDDVLIVPNYSDIESRSNVDLSVELPKGFKVSNPLIPANMATVTGYQMAKTAADMKSMAIIHRFMPIQEQFDLMNKLDKESLNYVGVSIGVKEEDKKNVDVFVGDLGVKIICIDIAHGDSKMCVEMCQHISKKYPDVLLIAGNVATGSGARRLWEAGADICKISIGSGSICTTRIETGAGVPLLTSLIDVAEEREKLKATGLEKWQKPLLFISDGGVNKPADCVKALCLADLVMAGNIFAGTIESPGETIEHNGMLYKEYSGSSTYRTEHVEGVKAMVPQKGPVADVYKRYLQGIRSGCSYQGVSNLIDLKDNPQFVKITNSGIRESGAHDVTIK